MVTLRENRHRPVLLDARYSPIAMFGGDDVALLVEREAIGSNLRAIRIFAFEDPRAKDACAAGG